jgi:hypothetical protein
MLQGSAQDFRRFALVGRLEKTNDLRLIIGQRELLAATCGARTASAYNSLRRNFNRQIADFMQAFTF